MRVRRARTLLIGAAIAALLATGCEWHFETLDGNGGPNGRTMNNVGSYNAPLLYNGRPHVFYHDVTTGDLRHGYYNGQAWAFETLDGAGGPNGRINADVGVYNAAVLYNGRPHVFYYDNTNGDLRHAYYTGSAWEFETLDGNGGPFAAVVLYNGRPHVFYLGPGTLRHAYYNGVSWAFETLDGAGGPNGRINANLGASNDAVLYNGRPHVFYYDGTNGDLRHAYYTGSAWGFETLDGNGGPNGRTINDVGQYNAALLYNGRPHVFSYDDDDNALRHAYYTGSAWGFETLDGNGGPNGRTMHTLGLFAAVVPYTGRPHAFYLDGTDGSLRHAYYTGSAWGFETLDGNGGPDGRTMHSVGAFNGALLYNGRPDVFYYDSTGGDLRHAYFG